MSDEVDSKNIIYDPVHIKEGDTFTATVSGVDGNGYVEQVIKMVHSARTTRV